MDRQALKPLPCRFPVSLTFPLRQPQSLRYRGRAETGPNFKDIFLIWFMSTCSTQCELEGVGEKGLPEHLLAASHWEKLHMAHPGLNNFITKQISFLVAGWAVQDYWFSLKAPESPLEEQGLAALNPQGM